MRLSSRRDFSHHVGGKSFSRPIISVQVMEKPVQKDGLFLFIIVGDGPRAVIAAGFKPPRRRHNASNPVFVR